MIVKVQRATGDPIAAERFRREAAVMKRLRHPNIVALYQFHDGDPAALVLEFVSGQTLAALVEADGWLSPLRTAQIMEDIAAALDCAHVQGVIHRDVKPSNILLARHGAARLSDFGVAHIDEDTPLTVMGDILGTIEYASPEQVHGNETPDARSDVYSLAAVAYFALTGTPPFRAADNSTQAQLSVMHRQVFADPPALRFHREDLSPEVESAVLRGLAKAPASRYPSAGQFAAALRAAVESGAGIPEQRAMTAATRRSGVLAGALAGTTLLLLGGIALWRAEQSPASHLSVARSQPSSQGAPGTKMIPAGPPPVAAASRQAASPIPVLPPVPNPAAGLLKPVAALPKPIVIVPKPTVTVVKVPTPKPAVAKSPAAKPAKAIALIRPQPVKTASKPAPVSVLHTKPLSPLHTAALAVRPKPLPKKAWLYVYARQNLAPLGPQERMAAINAQSIWVDGYRASDLAGGHWTSLSAGRHVVSFIPDPKSGFGPHKNVVVMLAPGAHVRKQILLPASSGSGAPLTAVLPAAHLPGTPPVLTPAISTHPQVGWYTVSGWVPGSVSGRKSALVRASAQWVKVDGKPVPSLALGGWAQLPAGKHVVVFQPTPTLGIGPKTWNINLSAQAHLNQRIPFSAPASRLALHPVGHASPVGQLSVSGWLPVTLPGQKPELVPIAAESIKIDGQPSPDLAHGRWVFIPAGRHVLVFQPVPGSGAEAATRVISLPSKARLNQLMPLPSAPLPATPQHLRNP